MVVAIRTEGCGVVCGRGKDALAGVHVVRGAQDKHTLAVEVHVPPAIIMHITGVHGGRVDVAKGVRRNVPTVAVGGMPDGEERVPPTSHHATTL